jgi:hypothetical protein
LCCREYIEFGENLSVSASTADLSASTALTADLSASTADLSASTADLSAPTADLSASTADLSVYAKWTKELSRYVTLTRREIAQLIKRAEEVVQGDPSLRFVLPTAVVLAVYSRNSAPISNELCDIMHVKRCTVQKVMKKLT